MELLRDGPELWLAGQRLEGVSGHDAGRALLAALYRRATGEDGLPEIGLEARGKPRFRSGPWHFSVTHTPSHALCALAREPLGLDGEEADRRIDLRLAEKILSPGEYARFSGARDPRLTLLKLWVLKEAGAKATGRGLGSRLWRTDYSPEDPRLETYDGCLYAVIFARSEENHAV